MHLIEIYLQFPSGLEWKITEHKSISQQNIMHISNEMIIYGYDTVYHTFCLKIPCYLALMSRIPAVGTNKKRLKE